MLALNNGHKKLIIKLFMCVHSSMKLLNKVINDAINFIKPKMTFIELKIYDLYRDA